MHASDGATALLGMPGFAAGAQLEVDGEVWLYVETTAVGHGRRRVKVRDLAMAAGPVVLVWAKRKWHCPEPVCEVSTWTETSEAIRPRAVLTERAPGRDLPAGR